MTYGIVVCIVSVYIYTDVNLDISMYTHMLHV